ECGDRLLATAPAEPGGVLGTDADAPLDQALRPRIVLAVGGEHDTGRAAARQGALQEAAGGERLVVGVGRQDEQALPGTRAIPFHSGPPLPANGVNPRSAACAQMTAIGPSPSAGRYSCRPGARSRGPSHGAPSSIPRAGPSAPVTA